MGSKKFYWLKLKDDFFTSREIKKLRRIAGGDTYTIIYLKLQLLTMKNDGLLVYEGTESSLAEQLSLELDEEEDNIKVTLSYLMANALMEQIDSDTFLIPQVVEQTGSETGAAERMRKLRTKRNNVTQVCNNVTPMLQDVQKSYTEIEIEKDIEIDKDKELNTLSCRSKTVPSEDPPFLNSSFSQNQTAKDTVQEAQQQSSKWDILNPGEDIAAHLKIPGFNPELAKSVDVEVDEFFKADKKKDDPENVKEVDSIKEPTSPADLITEVISQLNAICGTKYKAETDKTRRFIKARINEGFKLKDFITVIKKKNAEWAGTDMEKYLRPETLFGTKFEGYLNQKEKNNLPGNTKNFSSGGQVRDLNWLIQ